jgi:uncharacterized membrane protein
MSLAHATSADSVMDISLRVDGNGFATVEEHYIFESEGDYGMVPQPMNADNLEVYDKAGNLSYEPVDIGDMKAIKVNFRRRLEPKRTYEVWLRYGTHYLTTKDADTWTLSMYTATTPHKTILKVAYPEGAKIVTLQPQGILRTYVDEGVWLYPDTSELNFTSTYQHSGVKYIVTTTTTVPESQILPFQFNVRLFYGVVLGIVVLILTAIVYTLYKNRLLLRGGGRGHVVINAADDIVGGQKVVEGKVSYNIDANAAPRGSRAVKDSIMKMLDENELGIVRLLENSDEDEVTQAYIYKTTGIPKSSLSDILKHMEKRNVIERRSEGRVKWIKLKKWVLE